MKSEDLKLIKRIVEAGHALEALWEDEPQRESALNHLKALVEKCTHAQDEDLKRLEIHVRDLALDMNERHLGAILVPFERLLGRALRDDEFITLQTDRPPTAALERGSLAVIADNLRSAFNVGAIFRTADCFSAGKVVLTGYTATPNDDKTLKTSMGTQNVVTWEHASDAKAAVEKLKKEGYTIVALETADNAVSLEDFEWPEKPALLLGNERFGLDAETLSLAEHLVKIPMHGVKNSLNVGIAFGIAAADWRSKLEGEKSHALEPIGYFRSTNLNPYEARRQGALDQSGEVGIIELKSGHDFEQALESLEGFTRIWLIYRFDRNENWKPMVMPPRGPRIKRGVFATRSPHRPNPLGLTATELVKIEGRKIFVRGFDLLDGTPIYDIKPYIPYADAFPEAKAGWLEQTQAPLMVRFSVRAEEQLKWLHSVGVRQFKPFLIAQLEHDPLDEERKRVTPSPGAGQPHLIAYRTWRAVFFIKDEAVEIQNIFSGYSEQDLKDPADPYNDKSIHQEFKALG